MHGQQNIKKTGLMIYMYLAFERNTQGNTTHHPSKGDGNLLRKHSQVLERNPFSLKGEHSVKAKLRNCKSRSTKLAREES